MSDDTIIVRSSSNYYLPLFPIGSYLPSQVHIDFDPVKYRMKSTQLVEDKIAEIWERKLDLAKKLNKILFNASKFRLHDCKLIMNPHHHPPEEIKLQLGLTDYKTFIGVAAVIDEQQGVADAAPDPSSSSSSSSS